MTTTPTAKPGRILMVVGRATGGIGAHVDALVSDLRALGHEVRIVTDPSTAEHFGWGDALRLWPLRGRPDVALLDWHAPFDWHRIMRLAGQFDVVHAHGHQAAIVAAPAVLRARPRPGFVVSLHNDLAPTTPSESTASVPALAPKLHSRSGVSGAGEVLRAAARRAVEWALRRADLVTGASEDLVDLARRAGARRVELATVASPRVAGLLADLDATATTETAASTATAAGASTATATGASTDASTTTATGASTDASTEAARATSRRELLGGAGIDDPGHPLVLTVSRLAPQKDLPTLVRAAGRLRHPATWVVVGGGDEAIRAALEKEANGIRAGGAVATVHLLGPRADLTPWLRAADLFVLPSRWEARALVLQEAMAAGLPVVATRVGGLPGLVGEAGVLVEPGDPAALAEAVDALLTDPGRSARLGAAARRAAATWPTPGDEARRWVDRYAGLRRA